MTTEQVTLTGERAPPEYECPYPTDDYMHEHYERAGTYGIMHASDYEWSNVECTTEAYGDVRRGWSGEPPRARSLLFHTEWLDVDEASECVETIGSGMTFKPDQVTAVLRRIQERADEDVQVVVGREGSPVVYVWTCEPVHAYDEFRYMDSPPDELGGFPRAETFPGVNIGKDRHELVSGTPTLIRAWWD